MENKEYNRGSNNSLSDYDFLDKEGDSINIMEWVMRFLSYWYLFVIACVIMIGLAIVKNLSWMPNYFTESKVVIQTNTSSDFNFMSGFGSGPTNNELLILSSYDLVNKTVSELPFDVDYYYQDFFKTKNLYGSEPIRIISNYISQDAYLCEFKFTPLDSRSFEISIVNDFGKEFYPDFKIAGNYGVPIENSLFSITIENLYLPLDNNQFNFRFRSLLSLEEEFVSRMSLSYVGEQTSVISLSLVSNTTKRDRDFLDKLNEKFLERNLNEKNEEATRTIHFINEQLIAISSSLDSSETELRDFRNKYNMVDVNAHTSSILTKLTALDDQRSKMNLKEAYFDELSRYLSENIVKEKLVAPSSIGVSDPILLDLVTKFNEVQQKRNELGEKNPNYERYSRSLNEIKVTLTEVLENVRKIFSLEREAFNVEYSKAMQELQTLPERELNMVNVERQYKINDNYYTFLLQKQAEAQIRMASNVPDNKILQNARTSILPVNSSEKSKVYLIFLLLGIALPSIFIILKELLNTTIRSEADINKLTNTSVIGAILHTNNTKDKVITAKKTRSLYAERFRMLRSRLEFIGPTRDKISMLISSSESKDGKTHFVVNFAGSYSLLKKKVLLVDLDLRNPTLSKQLECDASKGITNLMIGEITLNEAIIKGRDSGLSFDFLPSGILPPNPAELLSSSLMKELFDTLKESYDYVLMDSSPLGLVADAYAISNMVDVNLIITRVGKTDKERFKNFMLQLNQDNIKNIYLVLNDVPVEKKGIAAKAYGNYYLSKSSKYYVDDNKYYTTDDE
ncbi:MAG: polysaccharide biosynthesis tyrosine autokinase [bacterium]